MNRKNLANALRALTIDAVEKAGSGHPGAPLGMADMAESLWRGFIKHNPQNPAWPDRDRFVLSNGHASMLLYGILHLTGYDVSLDDIKQFRQLGSKTPGHPENMVTPGVEVTTGPLGQGLAMAVGLALGERLLAQTFNRQDYPVVDHHTWVFAGDGCLMEGVSQEACSLAGTLGLGKLIALYDDNSISIDGPVKGWFSEDVPSRFAALGWHVVRGVDGHDGAKIDLAIREAVEQKDRPSLICCKTIIGYGSPHKAGTAATHGSPLGEEEAAATKEALDWNYAPFTVPQSVYDAWDAGSAGAGAEARWQEMFSRYEREFPELAAEYQRRLGGELGPDWPEFTRELYEAALADKAAQATRISGKKALDFAGPVLPALIGGSADLSGSVGTLHASSRTIAPGALDGNYLRYGVREFAMGAIMNGLAAHGGFIPYGGTFMVFSDYAKNAIRMSALMRRRVIWVLSHDSIGVGEDGPTHQPVEHLAALRMTPGVDVWRPCDNLETAAAWVAALERADAPSCLSLSRQNLAQQVHPSDAAAQIRRGGYILRPAKGETQAILIATGSEVDLAVKAAAEMEKEGYGIQVVSMPCCEVFDRQDKSYRDLVLPPRIRRRVAVEMAARDWWWKYVGLDGNVVGMSGFGESAPASDLFKRFGFSVANIVCVVKELLQRE